MSPEDAHLLEKDFTNFSRHGISQGEIKQLIQKFPEFVEKIEILADNLSIYNKDNDKKQEYHSGVETDPYLRAFFSNIMQCDC